MRSDIDWKNQYLDNLLLYYIIYLLFITRNIWLEVVTIIF